MDFLHDILGPDLGKAFLTILNIVFIESLLSVDNAAVLATMVLPLPSEQRTRALKVGLILAYIFRGTALILAGYLIQISWLKLIGGGYLLFLSFKFFYDRYFLHKTDEGEIHPSKVKRILGFNQFWSTVIMVELMDMVFSLDNVLAAVAYTSNIYIICLGVFIGIITMRLVAGYFVKLMHKFPFLDTLAFIVIAMLGLKLLFDYFAPEKYGEGSHSSWLDYVFSFGTLAVFILPIVTSVLFGFPKHSNDEDTDQQA